ncbi:hypothetical protein [Pseudomonas fluorescens]|nr:hypothetical protein [Pseudomonas fluorescens]
MNDNAVGLMYRSACIASKPAPTRSMQDLWEPGLPAMNDDEVGLKERIACVASKPAPT